MIWIQLVILLSAILIGAKMKGIGLGVMGMVGLLFFILLFHMRPADPPIDVMLIILAIVTTSATLQAAGGMDLLIGIAEKIIRRRPNQIIFIGPLVAFFLALFAGSSHIVYSLLPIISEVSAKQRIRPERPLSISVVASHLALTGSPMSAATAALATILAYPGAVVDIMKIGIPSCLLGILAGALSVLKMGKELETDPVFLEKMKDPAFARSIDSMVGAKAPAPKAGAKSALWIFGIAILAIVLSGSFPGLLPSFGHAVPSLSVRANGTLTTASAIEIITLSAAALIMLVTGTTPLEVSKSSLFTTMAVAVVSVFGVVWMSSTFISHNQDFLTRQLGAITRAHPWTFTFAIFLMAIFFFSQAATTKTMMPLGLALGISNPALIAMFPAVNGDFILPGYPTLLAAIQFDRTGSTHIGKFVLNHSFLRPGLVAITVAAATGFALSRILL